MGKMLLGAQCASRDDPGNVITQCSHYAEIASQRSAVPGGLLYAPQKLTLAS